MTSTDTITRPGLSDSDTDPDDVAHYANSASIAEAAVLGGKVKALCGYEFEPIRDPSGMPICKACENLLSFLD